MKINSLGYLSMRKSKGEEKFFAVSIDRYNTFKMHILEILNRRIKPATSELMELFAVEFSDSKISPNVVYSHHVIVGGLIISLSREEGRNKLCSLRLKIFINPDKKILFSNIPPNFHEYFAFIRRNFLSYIRQKYTKSCASFLCYFMRTQYCHLRQPVIEYLPTLSHQTPCH